MKLPLVLLECGVNVCKEAAFDFLGKDEEVVLECKSLFKASLMLPSISFARIVTTSVSRGASSRCQDAHNGHVSGWSDR